MVVLPTHFLKYQRGYSNFSPPSLGFFLQHLAFATVLEIPKNLQHFALQRSINFQEFLKHSFAAYKCCKTSYRPMLQKKTFAPPPSPRIKEV